MDTFPRSCSRLGMAYSVLARLFTCDYCRTGRAWRAGGCTGANLQTVEPMP
ncbi:hypothetical protein NA56DRAFT_749182, partial [Hyaloscypha hepaticicola]